MESNVASVPQPGMVVVVVELVVGVVVVDVVVGRMEVVVDDVVTVEEVVDVVVEGLVELVVEDVVDDVVVERMVDVVVDEVVTVVVVDEVVVGAVVEVVVEDVLDVVVGLMEVVVVELVVVEDVVEVVVTLSEKSRPAAWVKSRLAGVKTYGARVGVTRYAVPGWKPVWNQYPSASVVTAAGSTPLPVTRLKVRGTFARPAPLSVTRPATGKDVVGEPSVTW